MFDKFELKLNAKHIIDIVKFLLRNKQHTTYSYYFILCSFIFAFMLLNIICYDYLLNYFHLVQK